MKAAMLRFMTFALACILLFASSRHSPAAGEPEMSAAFQRFQFSFFEDPSSAQDALDTPSLSKLEGEERGRAETMLLAFLPDSRGVIGLGVLRSRDAEPRLTALFEAERKRQTEARDDARMQPGGPDEWHPSALLYLAHALWRIHPDARWPQAAIEVLSSAPGWVFRQEAVEALDGVNEPAAVQALTAALDDAEPLVRYAAARGLLTLHGLPADPVHPQDMMVRVMSKDAARHASGKQEILAAIAGRTAVGR
jgi:hypothetical protein